MTSYSDYFNIYTYRDPLIYFKVESQSNWAHREKAVKEDFFLKKFINGLDVAIFQEKPIFIPDILQSDKEVETPQDTKDEESGTPPPSSSSNILNGGKAKLKPPPGAEDILDDWNREDWDSLMVRMFDAVRTHKWAIVQLYNDYPWWRVFTYREIDQIVYNDFDIPVKAHALWTKSLPKAHSYNMHDEWINLVEANAEDLNKDGEINSLGLFVNWGHDIDPRIDGNDLESIWSLSIYLRYIMQDILSNSAKSSGFYWVMYGSGVSKTIKDDIVNAFEICGSSHIIGGTEQTIKQIEAMFPKNPEFSILAMDKVMKIFSGACGLPYLYFNGEKDTGGIFEENSSAMAQVNDKKKEVFGQLKHYILKLVEMRWGIKCDDVFPNIEEEEEEQYEEDIIKKRTPASDSGIESELKKSRLQS